MFVLSLHHNPLKLTAPNRKVVKAIKPRSEYPSVSQCDRSFLGMFELSIACSDRKVLDCRGLPVLSRLLSRRGQNGRGASAGL